jgi:hypothetical protein
MKKIWRYELKATQLQELEVPVGAKFLCAQVKDEKPCVWAEVKVLDYEDEDVKTELETRYIEMYATGDEMVVGMGVDREYIGTFQIEGVDGKTKVLHVYERTS